MYHGLGGLSRKKLSSRCQEIFYFLSFVRSLHLTYTLYHNKLAMSIKRCQRNVKKFFISILGWLVFLLTYTMYHALRHLSRKKMSKKCQDSLTFSVGEAGERLCRCRRGDEQYPPSIIALAVRPNQPCKRQQIPVSMRCCQAAMYSSSLSTCCAASAIITASKSVIVSLPILNITCHGVFVKYFGEKSSIYFGGIYLSKGCAGVGENGPDTFYRRNTIANHIKSIKKPITLRYKSLNLYQTLKGNVECRKSC